MGGAAVQSEGGGRVQRQRGGQRGWGRVARRRGQGAGEARSPRARWARPVRGRRLPPLAPPGGSTGPQHCDLPGLPGLPRGSLSPLRRGQRGQIVGSGRRLGVERLRCCSTRPETGWLSQGRSLFLTGLEARSLASSWSSSGGNPPLGCRPPTSGRIVLRWM